MKSLCTCAALAVAAAFAQQQFVNAVLRSNAISVRSVTVGSPTLTPVGGDNCTTEINKFRTALKATAETYAEYSDKDEASELASVVNDLKCADLFAGKYSHISSDIFMMTAAKPADAGSDMTCELAVSQWEKGFEAFKDGHPPDFKDYKVLDGEEGNVYADPNAVGLFSLLQTKQQTVACGTFSACTDTKFLFCYFKPPSIQEGAKVDPELWHALEVKNNIKPALEAKGKADENYLKAVNDVRAAAELSLAAFINPVQSLKREGRSKRSAKDPTLEKAVQTYLYQLTCEDIKNAKIKPAAKDQNFTVIYYIKDGKTAPTLTEAVEHWQTGFAKLKYKIPPVFKLDSMNDDSAAQTGAADPDVEASKIYKDSAVAGFVSIMAEEARQMACVEITGCEDSKAALLCFLHKPTLENDTQPISQALWTKIMKREGYTLPEFTTLEEGKNCLAEMNAVRTQEKLGLKPFLATAAKARTSGASSAVMQSVTCEAMDTATAKSTASTGPQIMITDGTTSLMYHTGTDGTCSEAVEAFKKGYEKFSTAPPAYDTALALYQNPAATNFASLISDGENTKVTCYSTNCAKKSLVCELSPAALKEGEKPVSEATFTKYTELMRTTETSGAAGSSRAALIGTVVMAIAAGLFSF